MKSERDKNLQVKMSGTEMGDLGQVAQEESTTVASLVRTSIQLFLAVREGLRRNENLYLINRDTGEKTQVVVPGMLAVVLGRAISRKASAEEKK